MWPKCPLYSSSSSNQTYSCGLSFGWIFLLISPGSTQLTISTKTRTSPNRPKHVYTGPYHIDHLNSSAVKPVSTTISPMTKNSENCVFGGPCTQKHYLATLGWWGNYCLANSACSISTLFNRCQWSVLRGETISKGCGLKSVAKKVTVRSSFSMLESFLLRIWLAGLSFSCS